MAQITLSSNTVIRPYRSAKGAPRMISFQESTAASTALIKVGQVVQTDTVTGTAAFRIVRASTAAVPNLSITMVGVAAEASTSDGSTTGLSNSNNRQIAVWAADPDTEFLFPSKISAVASTLVGTGLALEFDSTLSIHYLNANSTAGDLRVWITEVPNPGDTNGYLVGRFFSTAVSPAVIGR